VSHSFLEDVPASRLTSSTIRRMYELIDQAKTDAKFQELVYGVTKGLPNKDYRGEVSRIFDWAKRAVRYTRDPHGVELVQDVWATLSRGRGDCDDFTILLGAACEVMGAPCQIITVSTRPDKEPVHVYPEVKLGNRWTPLDATVRGARPGWAPRRITDRIVWTRKDVGIAGYDDETIEGLGMSDDLRFLKDDPGYYFKSSMKPVNFNTPDNISHTFADPLRGDPTLSRRRQPGAPYYKVATNSELVESPAPGNLPYGSRMPVEPEPLPSQNWSSISRPRVPMNLKPWPDEARKWSKDWGAMLPQPNVPEDREMSNVNGLGGLALGSLEDDELDFLNDAIEADITRYVKSGVLPPQAAPAAVSKAVDAVRSGDRAALRTLPATSRAMRRLARPGSSVRGQTPATSADHPPTRGMIRHGNLRAHASEYGTDFDPSCDFLPSMSGLDGSLVKNTRSKLYSKVHQHVKRHLPRVAHQAGVHPRRIKGLFNPAEGRRIEEGQVAGLGELGETPLPIDPTTTAYAAGAITDGILRVVDPADAQAVSQAVESGMKAIVGAAPAPAQPSLLSKVNLSGWGVPVLVLAGITGVAYFMSKPKMKFRRNPSRRRSRRYGGSRSSGGFEKYIPWALGVVAAYLILKPKPVAAGAAAPQQAGLFQNLLNMFKPSGPTSTQQAAGMVQAVSNPFTSILNTIFGAPKTAAPTTTTSTAPKIVTSYDIYGGSGSSSPSYSPNIVTSIDDVAPPPSSDAGSSLNIVTDYA